MRLIKKLIREQKGFSLTEVVIALGVFGMIGAALMGALQVSNTTILSAAEKTLAESLTRTALEYVKQLPYDAYVPDPDDPHYDPYIFYDSDSYDPDNPNQGADYPTLLGLAADPYYGDYELKVLITALDPAKDGPGDDDGLQQVMVEIRYRGKLALVTEDYKVNR